MGVPEMVHGNRNSGSVWQPAGGLNGRYGTV